MFRREPGATFELSTKSMEISREHGFQLHIPMAEILLDWSRMAWSGDPDEVIPANVRLRQIQMNWSTR
jgi:hypothetical protein